MSIPEAKIMSIENGSVRLKKVNKIESFDAYRSFLNNPEAYLSKLGV